MAWPSKLKLFRAWAKAMEEGAKMDTPDYGKKFKIGRTLRTSRPRRSARGRYNKKTGDS